MEYNGGLEKAILRDSELLSEVNDAFCKSHPLGENDILVGHRYWEKGKNLIILSVMYM